MINFPEIFHLLDPFSSCEPAGPAVLIRSFIKEQINLSTYILIFLLLCIFFKKYVFFQSGEILRHFYLSHFLLKASKLVIYS